MDMNARDDKVQSNLIGSCRLKKFCSLRLTVRTVASQAKDVCATPAGNDNF